MKKGEAKPEGEGTSTATRRHKGVPEDRVDEESDGIAGSDSPRFVAEIGGRRAATRRHEEAATRRHDKAATRRHDEELSANNWMPGRYAACATKSAMIV